MSTNLSGNALTLNNTSLTKDTLDLVKSYYYVPDNCKVGDTVILDGIECLCVATGVTIQSSNLTRIAVDKNHDLGYYQKYVGINQSGVVTTLINKWRWGCYGYLIGNNSKSTSKEVGYGLQNTIKCLDYTAAYTKGTFTGTSGDGYPFLWTGVNDFRSSHSDKWFVPSINELINYIYPNKSSLTFDTTTGGSPSHDGVIWSSSENYGYESYYLNFRSGRSDYGSKYVGRPARLCRAF